MAAETSYWTTWQGHGGYGGLSPAVEVASYGFNPASVIVLSCCELTAVLQKFDFGDMRQHLHLCLLNIKFECPFSKIEGVQQHSLLYDTVITIPIHCVFRMPHFKSDKEEIAATQADG